MLLKGGLSKLGGAAQKLGGAARVRPASLPPTRPTWRLHRNTRRPVRDAVFHITTRMHRQPPDRVGSWEVECPQTERLGATAAVCTCAPTAA
jgi:hypothetical protein